MQRRRFTSVAESEAGVVMRSSKEIQADIQELQAKLAAKQEDLQAALRAEEKTTWKSASGVTTVQLLWGTELQVMQRTHVLRTTFNHRVLREMGEAFIKRADQERERVEVGL